MMALSGDRRFEGVYSHGKEREDGRQRESQNLRKHYVSFSIEWESFNHVLREIDGQDTEERDKGESKEN